MPARRKSYRPDERGECRQAPLASRQLRQPAGELLAVRDGGELLEDILPAGELGAGLDEWPEGGDDGVELLLALAEGFLLGGQLILELAVLGDLGVEFLAQ